MRFDRPAFRFGMSLEQFQLDYVKLIGYIASSILKEAVDGMIGMCLVSVLGLVSAVRVLMVVGLVAAVLET